MPQQSLWKKVSALCINGKILNLRYLHHKIKPSQLDFDSRNTLKEKKEKHCFRNLYPWKRLSDLSNHLKENIIYYKDGLLAVNKPYGVRNLKAKSKVQKVPRAVSSSASEEDFSFSVEECLPHLKASLSVSQLKILNSAERYSSGIVLLGCNEEVCEKVENSKKIAKYKKIPNLIYWGITKGYPTIPALSEKVGIKLEDIGFENEKLLVIKKNFSKKSMLRGGVKPILVEYRTIAINKEMPASLLEITVSSIRNHFLRVYAATCAASILGDRLHGARTQMCLGKPVNIHPQNLTAFNVQPLPELICRSLNLPHNVDGHLLVPTMLHFRTIVLPHFFKDKSLVINASAPAHFKWTCEQFGFTIPD